MDASAASFLLQQLGYAAPTLLVAFIGAVAALATHRRHPKPSTLALLGCGVLIVTSLGVAGLQAHFFTQRAGGGMAQQTAQLMTLIGVAGSLGRAFGLGLIIAAVFTDRRDEALDYQ